MAHNVQGPMQVTVSLSEQQARDLDDLHRQRRANVGAVDQTSAPTQQQRAELALELLTVAIAAELE
jgi:hypothetical protein